MIQSGSSAASTSRSLEPVAQSVAATVTKGPGEMIMVVVRGRLFRDGIQSVLESPGRTVVGSCETLDHIGARLDSVRPPDLFVVGGYEPEHLTELFSAIRRLRARIPTSKWLILSPRTDPALLRQALESGADGLLLEDSPAEVLQLLTRLILLGHPFVPAPLARVLSEDSGRAGLETAREPHAVRRWDGRDGSPAQGKVLAMPLEANRPARLQTGLGSLVAHGEPESRRQVDLSDRENEILGCLVSGHSNKIIARKLDIAEATVKVHVKGLLRKMQVSNRTQAAIRALRYPMVPAATDNPSDGAP
jgi:two-component system, NarL family, nitrate/nitrite response regulator NarL